MFSCHVWLSEVDRSNPNLDPGLHNLWKLTSFSSLLAWNHWLPFFQVHPSYVSVPHATPKKRHSAKQQWSFRAQIATMFVEASMPKHAAAHRNKMCHCGAARRLIQSGGLVVFGKPRWNKPCPSHLWCFRSAVAVGTWDGYHSESLDGSQHVSTWHHAPTV